MSKITVYMTADEIADLDALRADLQREGLNVDRSRMVRTAIGVAADNPDEWARALREDR